MKCRNCATEFQGNFCPKCGTKNEATVIQPVAKKNKAETVIKIVLSIFIGCVAGFILMLINEGLHALITCGLFAIIIASIAYAIFSNSNLKNMIAVVTFILAFIIYIFPYSYACEENESYLIFILVAFCPYMVFSYFALSE